MKKIGILVLCALLLCACSQQKELLTSQEKYTVELAKKYKEELGRVEEFTLLEAKAAFLGTDFGMTVSRAAQERPEMWSELNEEARYFLGEARYVLLFRLRSGGKETERFCVVGMSGYDLSEYFSGTNAEVWLRELLAENTEELSVSKLQKYIF